jgi:hypothetical protein
MHTHTCSCNSNIVYISVCHAAAVIMVPATSFPSQATQAISFLALPAIMAFVQPAVNLEVLPPPPPPPRHPLPEDAMAEEPHKKARISGQEWLDSQRAKVVAEAAEEPMAEEEAEEPMAQEPEAGAQEGLAGGKGGPAGEEESLEAWPTSWVWLSTQGGGELNFFYQEAIWIDFQEQEAKDTCETAEEPFG